jgi:nucleoside-diphosphate-sugar epimerase
MKVLVLGGTRFLGPPVVREFAAMGLGDVRGDTQRDERPAGENEAVFYEVSACEYAASSRGPYPTRR